MALSDYRDFIVENSCSSVNLIRSNGISHDRFIVLDYNTENERVFHCGHSSKDAGYKTSAIVEFLDGVVKEALHNDLERMLSNPELLLS